MELSPRHRVPGDSDTDGDSPIARFLLTDARLALLLLCAREYLGLAWLLDGISILREAVPFAMAGQLSAAGTPLPTSLIRLNPAIPLLLGTSEVVIGLFLVLGAFTGLTAFVSIVLSVNTVFPGPAVADPIAFGLTMLVILAWRTAGWYGLDRWLFKPSSAAIESSSSNRPKLSR